MRVTRAARTGTVVAVVVAASVLAAGCGGGGSSSSGASSPDDWANSVCSALTTWANSLKTATGSLQGNLSKESLTSASDDVSSATNQLASDLKGLGKPDTEGGDKAKSTLDTLSGQLSQDVDTIKKTADDASKGSGGIVKAVSSISTTLTTAGNQVQTAFSSLQQLDTKGELEKAFENSASCKKLTSQSG
jgi:hypothetical protein